MKKVASGSENSFTSTHSLVTVICFYSRDFLDSVADSAKQTAIGAKATSQ